MSEPEPYGPWLPLREIGRGGMGVVYRVRHAQTGQLAALKVVRPGQRFVHALRRELFALSCLDHPQIVRVLDHGTRHNVAWYAMAWVQGPDLLEHLGPSRDAEITFPDLRDEAFELPPPTAPMGLPLQQALTLGRGLCHPIAYLHGEQLVHGDLKLRNILLGPDQRPVLIDFGLASLARGRDELGTTRLSGTPSTLSPEQIRGEVGDARSDLYALGCLLFRLFTGQDVFTGSPSQVLRAHVSQPPPRVSMLRPDVPAAVDALVERLLAKDPRDRPGRALAVAEILDAAGATWSAPSRLPAVRPYTVRPPLIGREVLAAELDALVRSGQGGAAALLGPAGSGKTRLLRGISQSCRIRGRTVLAVDGYPGGTAGAARRLLTEIALVRIPGDPLELWGSWGPLLIRYAPQLGQLVPGLASAPPPEPLPPTEDLERLATAIGDVLGRLAAILPLCVIVDDLQWADDLLLSVIRRLVLRASDPSLLLLLAWRPDEAGQAHAVLQREVRTLALDPLPPAAIEQIVSGALAAEPPPALIRSVVHLARGSPMWAVEAVRTAVQTSAVLRVRRGWRTGPGPLPDTIASLLAIRIAAVPEPSRRTLARAAVQGSKVLPDLLGLDPSERARAIRELTLRALLDEVGGALRFPNEALRQAVLDTLTPEAQRAHHAALAAAIAAGPARLEHLGELARHQAGSGDLAAAIETYAQAEHAAEQRSDTEEVTRMMGASLALPVPADLDRVRLRLRLARHLILHTGQDASHEIARLHAEAEQLDDPRARAMALEAEGLAVSTFGDRQVAEALLHDALQLWPPEATAERARLSLALYAVYWRNRDAPGALAAARQATDADPGNVEAWRRLAWAQMLGGDAEAAYQTLASVRSRPASPALRAILEDAELVVLHQIGQLPPDAGQRCRRIAEVLEGLGMVRNAGVVLQHGAVFFFHHARHEDALGALDQALRAAERLGDRLMRCYAAYHRSRVRRIGLGDLDGARADLALAELEAGLVGSIPDRLECLAERVHLALARSEPHGPWLEQLHGVQRTLDQDTPLGEVHDGLQRALADHAEGRTLLHGQSVRSLTEAQRQRALQEGLLSASALEEPPAPTPQGGDDPQPS